LKEHTDIAEVLDEGCMTTLFILDSSAPLDVIDHSMLLKDLEHSSGIKEKI